MSCKLLILNGGQRRDRTADTYQNPERKDTTRRSESRLSFGNPGYKVSPENRTFFKGPVFRGIFENFAIVQADRK